MLRWGRFSVVLVVAMLGCDGPDRDDADGTEVDADADSDSDSDTDSDTDEDTATDPETEPDNEAPVAQDDEFLSPVDETVKLMVTDNDSDADGTVDPKSVKVVTAAQGTVTADTTDGGFWYAPDDGFVGKDSFTYTVKDDQGLVSEPATVVIDVGGAPILEDDVLVVNPDETSVGIDVLANDTDLTGTLDPATLTIVSQGTKGTASVVDGEVVYTPTGSPSGSDSFTYTVSDDEGNEGDPATVTVEFNNAPTVVDDTFHIVTDEPSALAVLLNDEDNDGGIDPSSVVLLGTGTFGTATVQPDGTLVYTPSGSFDNNDSLLYEVSDVFGATAKADVNLIANLRPLLVDDAVVVQKNSAGNVIAVMSNDTDPDGDTLETTSLAMVAAPTKGTAAVSGGSVLYTPNADTTGTDEFSYRLRDVHGAYPKAGDEGMVSVRVNAPPVDMGSPMVSFNFPGPVVLDVLDQISDPDGDALDPGSVEIITSPAQGTVSVDPVTGEVTYTPDADAVNGDGFTFTVMDAAGGVSEIAGANVFVNKAPALGDDGATMLEDGVPINILILDNDDDPNNGTGTGEWFRDDDLWPTVELVGGTAVGGSFQLGDFAGEPIITFGPTKNFNGLASVDYRVCDDMDHCSVATVVVTVTPVADIPQAQFKTIPSLAEAGFMGITTEMLEATNPDNLNPAFLIYKVLDNAEGSFQINTGSTSNPSWVPLATQATFTYSNLVDGRIRYLHDGSEPDGPVTPTLTVYYYGAPADDYSQDQLDIFIQAANDKPVCAGQVADSWAANGTYWLNKPNTPEPAFDLVTALGCVDEEDGTDLKVSISADTGGTTVTDTLTGKMLQLSYSGSDPTWFQPGQLTVKVEDKGAIPQSVTQTFKYGTNFVPEANNLSFAGTLSFKGSECKDSVSSGVRPVRIAFEALLDENEPVDDSKFSISGVAWKGPTALAADVTPSVGTNKNAGTIDKDKTFNYIPATLPVTSYEVSSATVSNGYTSSLTENAWPTGVAYVPDVTYSATTGQYTVRGTCILGTGTFGTIFVNYTHGYTDEYGAAALAMTTPSTFKVDCTCTE